MTETQQISMLGVSTIFQESEGNNVATFRQLRDEALYTTFQLAIDANVSVSTINRLEGTGKGTVTARKTHQVLEVLSKKLGRTIRIEDVQGLQERIVQPKSRRRSDGESNTDKG